MRFQNYVVMFLVVGLFLVVMVSFSVSLAYNNHSNQSLASDPNLNKTVQNLVVSLEDASNSVTSSGQTFATESEGVTTEDTEITLPSIIGVYQTGNAVTAGMLSFFNALAVQYLGLDLLTVSILGAILMITLVIAGWALFRSGR